MGFLCNFTHWTFKDTPPTLIALRAAVERVTTSLRAQRSLTTIGLITHIWAVGSVVTQVFHEDTCPVTTPVLIRHAGSDFGADWKGRRGTVGRMSNVHATTTLPHEAGYNSHSIRSKHKQDEELQRTVRINAVFWFYTGCKSRKKQHNTNKQTNKQQIHRLTMSSEG